MADDAQDRRLPATERKIRKARAEGQVARSRDLAHLAAIGAGVAILLAFAPGGLARLQSAIASGLRFDAAALADPQTMLERLADDGWAALAPVLLFGGLLGLAALLAGVLAGGWNFSFKALEPRPDKLDPIAGIGRLLSGEQLLQTLKACALALILGTIGLLYLRAQLPRFTDALALPLPAALGQTGQALADGLLWQIGRA